MENRIAAAPGDVRRVSRASRDRQTLRSARALLAQHRRRYRDIKKRRATSCPAGGHWRCINHRRKDCISMRAVCISLARNPAAPVPFRSTAHPCVARTVDTEPGTTCTAIHMSASRSDDKFYATYALRMPLAPLFDNIQVNPSRTERYNKIQRRTSDSAGETMTTTSFTRPSASSQPSRRGVSSAHFQSR